jgi:riboflavin synthase
MFTGLIREIATVQSFANNILKLKAKHKPDLGDSIAVNGTCLTVIACFDDGFSVELADETRKIIDTDRLNAKVHIEPAMQMGDRFDGHIVQGHVDTVGEIIKINKGQNGVDFYVKVDKKYLDEIVPKGSITIDGVSLTVNSVYEDSFRLTIIPHTIENTIIRDYKVGTRVNIETDMFAKYIKHILKSTASKKELTWDEVDKKSFTY